MAKRTICLQENESNNCLFIYTLGQFQVFKGDRLLSDTSKSCRLWELFKFLITNREKVILPESVLEALWPDQSYVNPKHALRSLIYRLRQLLQDGAAISGDDCVITFSQGYYKFNARASGYWLDTEVFESLCQIARDCMDSDPEKAIGCLQEALVLYKGEYLPECSYQDWAVQVRYYYHRLFIRAALDLSQLLFNAGRYQDVVHVCEKTFLTEPFEEELHVRYMHALLKLGQHKHARVHYENITAALYRELGIKPSRDMRDIYKLSRPDRENLQLDIHTVQDTLLEKRDTDGAFCCTADDFYHIYNLERRRIERSGQGVYIAVLTVTKPGGDYTPLSAAQKEIMTRLQHSLQEGFRKGDVVARWNDTQFVMLLPVNSQGLAEKVLTRFVNQFNRVHGTPEYTVHWKLQPILLSEPLLSAK